MTGGLWAMAAGILARDPERRTGTKGEFAIATIRVGNGDAVQWISVIAFGDAAGRLLELRAGDSVAVSGRAELSEWTGRGGAERHGIRIVASEITAARPRPLRTSDDRSAPRQRRPYAAPRPAQAEDGGGNGRPFDDEIPF